ncbi:MAG: hypothetical protein IJW70_10055 [Clostridia bacterium]|nr:hypothetical protein [Clostridia bacterium]
MNRSAKGIIPVRTHTNKGSPSRAAFGNNFTSGLLWGLALCFTSGFATLLIGALVAYLSPDPDAWIAPLGFGAMVLSCLLGGLGVGLKNDSAILPCSLLCGCIYVGLGLLLGLFFGSEARQSLTLGLGLGASLGIRAGLIALFCTSAVLTTQIKSKLQARPRRR